MSIITISRGSYSRGKEVAEKLAQKLGYECISRDILIEASEEFNIPEIKLVRALHDAPTVLERFTYGKERYVSYIRSAILHHVLKDNIVYHGLAGHYFLRDIPHVFKVRIIADMKDRVEEEMKRENISSEQALYILQKDDEERRKWGIQVTGTDTWDSRLYDMVIHIKNLKVDDVVEILAQTVQKPPFQTTAESLKIIRDRALAAKVQARLAKVAPMGISVTADNGVVSLFFSTGTFHPLEDAVIAEAEKIAGNVEGVEKVVFATSAVPGGESHSRINPFHNM